MFKDIMYSKVRYLLVMYVIAYFPLKFGVFIQRLEDDTKIIDIYSKVQSNTQFDRIKGN